MDEQANSSPRVLAIVVTHNGRPWLEACLQSIAAQDYPAFDVIVVDNASRRPIERGVGELLPEAQFIKLDRNVGFGAAANAALERSDKAPHADYYLFIHDDVALDEDCIGLLAITGMDTGAGVVGGKAVGWDDPDRLVEVGMSADQLGYGFTGLEEGEIDQGQHDAEREVLFVSNACVLVSRTLIERCGSWDGAYFAFGEDLDLCLRARLAGFKVVVQPSARFRHAVALANEERDADDLRSIRFYTRRNRLRTITKTAAAYRMWAVLLLYGILTVSEIVILAALRRFRDIPDYPKAFWSFFLSTPDVIRRRRAVQKRRTVADRRIRRLMVRDLHRARVFFERRLREWEVGTLQFGSRTLSQLAPSHLRGLFIAWMRQPSTLLVVLVVVALGIAMRKVLFGEPLGAGSMWPFPDPARRLITDYLAGWRDVSVGTSSAAPPALVLLWLASLIALGRENLAQSLVFVVSTFIGLVGMWRFMAKRTSLVWAKAGAVAVYALGPGLQNVVQAADLGALAVYAGGPFIAVIALRMIGPTPAEGGDRPATLRTNDVMTQDSVRLGLVCAPVIALAPSALIALAFFFFVWWLFWMTISWDRRETLRRARWLGLSLVVSLIVLIPWSIEAMRPRGAILGPIFSARGGGETYAPLWSRLDFESMMLFGKSGWIALVLPLAVALGASMLASPIRRRETRLLITSWLLAGLAGGAVSKAWLPAPVASPAIWTTLSFMALAVVFGHFVAGLRDELPRHALGWRHALAGLVSFAMAAGFVLGWAPALTGWDRPPPSMAAPVGQLGQSISSFFVSNAETVGEYRILWLGDRWVDPIRSGLRRMEGARYFLTSESGLTMLDAQEPPPSRGEMTIDSVVDAMVARQLHHAGHLLAPASIRYIVVDTSDQAMMSSMARQRDIALEHQQTEIAVFRNLQWLPRAALVPPGLARVASAGDSEERDLMLAEWVGGRRIASDSQSSFSDELPRTHHPSILVGDNFNPGWKASVGDIDLEHSEAFGWANHFSLPAEASGEVKITYSRRWIRVLWLLAQLWIIAMAGAMARLGGGATREGSVSQVEERIPEEVLS